MTNINCIMNMTKSFIGGEIDSMSYALDFPFEVETRYQMMVSENHAYADLIFECLVEGGAYKFNELSDTQFKKLIQKQFDHVRSVACDGFC